MTVGPPQLALIWPSSALARFLPIGALAFGSTYSWESELSLHDANCDLIPELSETESLDESKGLCSAILDIPVVLSVVLFGVITDGKEAGGSGLVVVMVMENSEVMLAMKELASDIIDWTAVDAEPKKSP